MSTLALQEMASKAATLSRPLVKCAKCETPFPAERVTARFCSPKCRLDNYRAKVRAKSRRLGSLYTTNAAAVAALAQLYIPDGAIVADVTYGRGKFWTKTDTSRFTLLASDLVEGKGQLQADFRRLPYADGTIDAVVLDPPYVRKDHPRMFNNDIFGGSTAPASDDDVLVLYRAGMAEARRVLKPRGRLVVKCMDQVGKDSRQRWFSRALPRIAEELGMFMRDEAQVRANKPPAFPGWQRQRHIWKKHSHLLLFEREPQPCHGAEP